MALSTEIHNLRGSRFLKEEVQNTTMFEFKNALLAYRMDYESNMKWGFGTLRKRQAELVALIRKEYEL